MDSNSNRKWVKSKKNFGFEFESIFLKKFEWKKIRIDIFKKIRIRIEIAYRFESIFFDPQNRIQLLTEDIILNIGFDLVNI